MSDLERLLSESLRDAGESYEPADQAEARRRFLERARRRRWYGIAQVAAAAGLAVAAVLFFTRPTTEGRVEPRPQVAGAPEIVARVAVGGDPVSIDATAGSEIWVTGGDRLVAIDPETNEAGAMVLDLPADEVAVGEGSLWVAHDGSTGRITEIDPDTGEIVDGQQAVSLDADEGTEVTWDIAAEGDSLWAVDGLGGSVYRFGSSPRERVFGDFTWSDVAVGEGQVWVLDQSQGRVFNPVSHPRDESNLFTITPGEDSDLAVGLGYVWVSSGDGTLRRLSPATGDQTELSLGDSYMDLTVHEKSVWALVDVDDKHKELFEINPGTMEIVGEPLEIEGDANDVVAEAGSVWVADGSGEVLRIEPSRDADGAPLPAPDESQSPGEEDPATLLVRDLVFVYSQDGELFAETRNSGSVQLTDTIADFEKDPAMSPDGRTVVFEIHDGQEDEVLVAELDLQDMSQCCLRGEAEEPTISAGGNQIAWVAPGSADGQTEINIGQTGSKGYETFPVSDVSEPLLARNLAFDHTNRYLSFEAGYEGTALFVAPLTVNKDAVVVGMGAAEPVHPDDRDQGATYKAISSATEVNVIKVCCRSTEGDAFETAEFGEVEMVTHRYTRLQALDELGLDLASDELFTSYLRGFSPTVGDSGIEWTRGQDPTWLVGDGSGLWVIKPSTGEATELPMSADGGAAAPNELAINPFAGAD